MIRITKDTSFRLDEWYCNWYQCFKCKAFHIMIRFNYCPKCGIPIIWELTLEEDDNRREGIEE